jgi:cytosine/adenosine deaminase-related metal-dependent hydrolase
MAPLSRAVPAAGAAGLPPPPNTHTHTSNTSQMEALGLHTPLH